MRLAPVGTLVNARATECHDPLGAQRLVDLADVPLTSTGRIVVRAGRGHAFDLLDRSDPAPEPTVTGRRRASARE